MKKIFLLIYFGVGMHLQVSSSDMEENGYDLGENIVALSIYVLSATNTYITEPI